jgi:hypothetical protein
MAERIGKVGRVTSRILRDGAIGEVTLDGVDRFPAYAFDGTSTFAQGAQVTVVEATGRTLYVEAYRPTQTS